MSDAVKIITGHQARIRAVLEGVAKAAENAGFEVNGTQALLVAGMSDGCRVGDLKAGGIYVGSNTSYNIRELTEAGFVAVRGDVRDNRGKRVFRTDTGKRLAQLVEDVLPTLLDRAGLAADRKAA